MEDAVRQISLEETSHYQITRGILQNPAAYWKHLQAANDENVASNDSRVPSTARQKGVKRRD